MSSQGLSRLEHSLRFRIELATALLSARIRGIEWAVRYLRNPHPRVTAHLLRRFNAHVGSGTTFKRSLCLDNVYEDENSAGDFNHLRLGSNCYIGDGVFLDLAGHITIGDNVVVAGRAALLTHSDCNRSQRLAERFPRQCAPIQICDDVWLGFGATVLAGVRIESYTVIAAGSIVTENLAGGAVYAGAPASRVRALDQGEMHRQTAKQKALSR